MSMTETIRPTLTAEDTDGGGYVLDGANAFDQNAATFSRVIAELAGQTASQILSGFPADTLPGARTLVVAEFDLSRFGWTAADRAHFWFRPTAVAAWSSLGSLAFADVPESSALRSFDVTAIAAAHPATGFELAVWFGNDYPAGIPPFPQAP
jgi:hypothetical protein